MQVLARQVLLHHILIQPCHGNHSECPGKELFEEIGMFNKHIFMYFEDVDLCCKVRKSGKDVIYLPEAKMLHLHNQESTKKINKMTVIHLQSMFKFYYKYYTNKI